jgi:serine/threonine protein kinase
MADDVDDSMNDSPGRDRAVFTEAVRLSGDERAEYLERACGQDAKLRQRVEALLKTHDHVGDFLEESPQKASIEARVGGSTNEKPGDRIGRYKLLQQIGEGGWGVVFMAEQEEPVRRMVALKVVKPGMDTKSVIARFEAERQALALMEHPNIAHVLDAGATENGRPYFVMELVRGTKITDYCDQSCMPTADRLELFIQVCNAVQHAHQKGVIHRDIKPSNILVTTSAEGKPLPKVIDFGIAKATTGLRLTDKTLFTAFEMLIGTPAYMSPEQAALTSVDVDTRTDIYGLGVLLYELLTGTTPFDARELLKAGLDEVRRVIQTEEPVRPSTRLSTMMAADLTNVAQQRHADPPKLIHDVRGDLDWIVMTALEKDRTRRYPTANGLAMDVQRYLSGEMVSARPPSSLYKFRKLFQKHKLLVSGFGAILVLLIILLGFTYSLLLREKRVHQESELLLAGTMAHAYINENQLEKAVQSLRRELGIRGKLQGAGYMPTIPSLSVLIQVLMHENKFDEIEELLNEYLIPANVSRSEYQGLLYMRADTLARGGRWAKAAADATTILKDHPEDCGSYHRLAPLLVAAKDLAQYQRLCQQMVARFGDTQVSTVADQMAKDCLILPSSGVDLRTVAAMAEIAVSTGRREPAYTFFQVCKALAEYRQGHFDEAVKWSQLAAANPYPHSQTEAYAILAMAQHQLRQEGDARAALAKCGDDIHWRLPKLGTQDLGGDWKDWIIAHALFTEAQTLLGTPSPGADSSKPLNK